MNGLSGSTGQSLPPASVAPARWREPAGYWSSASGWGCGRGSILAVVVALRPLQRHARDHADLGEARLVRRLHPVQVRDRVPRVPPVGLVGRLVVVQRVAHGTVAHGVRVERPSRLVQHPEAELAVRARRVRPRLGPGTQFGSSSVPVLMLYGWTIAAVWTGNSPTPSQKIFTVSTVMSPGSRSSHSRRMALVALIEAMKSSTTSGAPFWPRTKFVPLRPWLTLTESRPSSARRFQISRSATDPPGRHTVVTPACADLRTASRRPR